MADEERVATEEERTEEVDDVQAEQSVSREQIDEILTSNKTLHEQIEQIKKAQAGVDKENRKLREELQQKNQGEKTLQEQLEELRQDNRRKEIEQMRMDRLQKAGLMDAAPLLRIDTTSEDGMDQFTEMFDRAVQAEADKRSQIEINKRFPKEKEPPRGGKQGDGTLSYQELMQMSDADIKKIPKEQLNAIIEKAKQKTE